MTSTLPVAPWRVFSVEVRALRQLSPSFLRVTFTGPDLDGFADNGYDQRIKLALPLDGETVVELPDGPNWYQQWRELPDDRRFPVRTYTVRAVRQDQQEVDIDLVLHGDGGPATRWARRAQLGDRLGLVGPDAGYPGVHGGLEFQPPQGSTLLLLAGDETAAPAICAILERLPVETRGHAVIEVPHPDDELPVAAPPGMTVTWLPRTDGPYGSRLTPAVTALATGMLPSETPSTAQVVESQPLSEVDVDADQEIFWDVPTSSADTALYAWLAGEAGVIRGLRRHLVGDRGLDRRAVAFMGYWRLGRSEG